MEWLLAIIVRPLLLIVLIFVALAPVLYLARRLPEGRIKRILLWRIPYTD